MFFSRIDRSHVRHVANEIGNVTVKGTALFSGKNIGQDQGEKDGQNKTYRGIDGVGLESEKGIEVQHQDQGAKAKVRCRPARAEETVQHEKNG